MSTSTSASALHLHLHLHLHPSHLCQVHVNRSTGLCLHFQPHNFRNSRTLRTAELQILDTDQPFLDTLLALRTALRGLLVTPLIPFLSHLVIACLHSNRASRHATYYDCRQSGCRFSVVTSSPPPQSQSLRLRFLLFFVFFL